MTYRDEIQNILRSEGIIPLEANKAIFGIAVIGLLIGKEKLETVAYDIMSGRERDYFKHSVMTYISDDEIRQKEIMQLAFEFIPRIKDSRLFIRIIEIVLQFDLHNIVFHMNIFEDIGEKEYPLSSVSWINNLVVKILSTQEGKTLLNADCGTGDFIQQAFETGRYERIVGYSYVNLGYTIAKIRSYFSYNRIDIYNDSLFFPATQEKFDMAYNTYPLMYKYDSQDEARIMVDSWDFQLDFSKKYSSNLLWIVNALQSVKPDGMVVSLVPNGVLFNNIDVNIRKYLIENNYIDTIISLPDGILPFSGVSTSLIILKKSRKQSDSIRMIDATNIFSIQRRNKFFTQENIEYIVDLYAKEGHTENSFDVGLDEIVMNEFYLGINRYCEYSLINPYVLADVTRSIFRGYQINAKELDEISIDNDDEESDYRIINISDIQAEGFVSKDLKAVRIDDALKYNKYCVKDGDIIITAKNTTIKSAIYRSHGEYKAILTGNLIAIRVNETKINPYYLKAFIDSEQGEQSLKSIQTGTSIITINPNNLKDMKVSLLEMPLQIAIAEEYKKNLNLIEELLEKYNEATGNSSKIFETAIKRLF